MAPAHGGLVLSARMGLGPERAACRIVPMVTPHDGVASVELQRAGRRT